MATVTKSSPVINPKSLNEDLKLIEDRYTGYTSEALGSEISRRREKISKLEPDTSDYKDLAADLEDFECVLSMAETVEALLLLAKRMHLACELKADYDHTVGQVVEAIEATDDVGDHEVSIDVLGDVIPPRVEFEGNLWLHTVTEPDGTAYYTLS